jgi:acetoin utilization deacetylase AcuC-like enzyme
MTALLADPLYNRHIPGPGHPERPERLDAVLSALDQTGLAAQMPRIPPRAATEDEVAACHTRKYIDVVRHDVAQGYEALSTGDTPLSPDSLEVALQAVGGVLNAVDAVVERRAQNAFCAVRPPGHHATPGRGMGFCIFNNVAIAARYAQRRHGIERVLIADWDVHHGNGTQDIFYADGSVFCFSTHQHPWYPGTGRPHETGEGAGRGATLNCPFPEGSGRAEILGAFQDKLLPAARDFQPDLVLVSAGFDSRLGDPLGRFTLSDADFADLTALMLEIADTYAGGRLVSVLEGGYSLDGLASASMAHVEALMGDRGYN